MTSVEDCSSDYHSLTITPSLLSPAVDHKQAPSLVFSYQTKKRERENDLALPRRLSFSLFHDQRQASVQSNTVSHGVSMSSVCPAITAVDPVAVRRPTVVVSVSAHVSRASTRSALPCPLLPPLTQRFQQKKRRSLSSRTDHHDARWIN